ncbi:hypothetical protein C5748_04085 [Phyllobacterium phragmitis]|uniref:Uncharacterized protein n=1 Tax=Phyllobacterium phragmitis TaxID=2670329 RepID=A0A2S9IY01_9HYPH|nr:hypothetical protein [Phyllobacterium phragmitis]PRD45378.1 hypothetical protein C5748_04085 [Phyllobacterium phragmitis]
MADKLELLIELFTEFSDSEFQKRSWFGIGPEISSPDELCNRIDDLGVEKWVVENSAEVGKFLSDYIIEFLDDINKLPEVQEAWISFSSPSWIAIRLRASVIRDLLVKMKMEAG